MKKIWICFGAALIGFVTVVVFLIGENSKASADVAKPWMEKKEEVIPEIEKQELKCDEIEISKPLKAEDVPEFGISKESMVEEIIFIWEEFFKDERVPPTDIRRDSFGQMANWLADAILIYQYSETDIGGKLPIHPSTHRLLAVMTTFECSVTPNVKRGRKGEVGPLQVMGAALGGYKEEEVDKNDRLGFILGARWLAVAIRDCYPDGYEEWDEDMWNGPMSWYAAGSRAIRADGTCKNIKQAKDRLTKVKMYKSRILMSNMLSGK